ncbi:MULTISPECIES: hypothetical protein [unclassified Nocardia]|uniref:hypothetical protein n=1 Tax=Nocardia sp. NPDC019255 TaxID=3154591 RepID=UPI0033D36719
MSSPTLPVAVLGTGPLAQRIAERIEQRPDLAVTGRVGATQAPPEGTKSVVFVPAFAEITTDIWKDVVPQLLGDGYDVISTAPRDGRVSHADILAACRAGRSTFHATGGFQATIPARLVRSLAEVTRGIRRLELVEELDLPETGVYPWETLRDTGIGTTATDAPAIAAAAVDGYYAAGLRVLHDAVFPGSAEPATSPSTSVDVITDDSGTVEKVIVERDLGSQLSYRSIWTAAVADVAPLRYRLVTTTDTAKGTAGLRFRFTDGLHPADHLSCVQALDAIRPIYEHGPGIARRDLSITRLMPDDRLPG